MCTVAVIETIEESRSREYRIWFNMVICGVSEWDNFTQLVLEKARRTFRKRHDFGRALLSVNTGKM